MLGYGSFLVAGLVGVPSDEVFGVTVMLRWEPGAGLLLSITGCLIAVVAAALGLRRTAR